MNKKELEKKKNQKRKEKQMRKEERKKNGGVSSMDDMIMYVDEFGQLTSTPPDPTKKKEEVDIESISVSTPKMEEVEEEDLRGRVDYYNADKGYGFIKNLNSVEKYFFHINNAPDSIAEGNIVTFELEAGKKGMNAVNINIEK